MPDLRFNFGSRNRKRLQHQNKKLTAETQIPTFFAIPIGISFVEKASLTARQGNANAVQAADHPNSRN
jgi:hypothetical protein